MDWNDLPQELVDLTASKVFAKDRHNFSQVCRSWNAAAVPITSPCLMFNQRRNKHLWKLSQHNNFFYMDIPKLEGGKIRFANYGWLLISRDDDETLFFYDPFNHHMIELPSPSDSDCAGYTTICFFHPPTSPDCFLVGIETEISREYKNLDIGVLKHGEDEWDNHTYRSQTFKVSLGPPILHDGLLYFLDVEGNVATFDVRQHGLPSSWKIYPNCLKLKKRKDLSVYCSLGLINNIKEHFLIKPKGEQTIFAVFTMHGEREVKVFRLSKKFKWTLVKDLGDRVFYASNTSSLGYTTDFKGMKNKIFFPMLHDDSVVYYSLDTHKYHSFEGGYSSTNSHGLKRLDFATWIMPAVSTEPQLPSESLKWCS